MKKLSKVIFILLFLMLFILENINAQEGDVKDFFTKWAEGAFEDFDAKIILFVLLSIAIATILIMASINWMISILAGFGISFIFIGFITPESILGVFKSTSPFVLTLILIIPLLIVLTFTYVAANRGNKFLLTAQFLVWLILFLFMIIRLSAAFLATQMDVEWAAKISDYISLDYEKLESSENFWFWGSTIISFLISLFMVVFNRTFISWLIKKQGDANLLVVEKKASNIKTGTKFLDKVAEEITKS